MTTRESVFLSSVVSLDYLEMVCDCVYRKMSEAIRKEKTKVKEGQKRDIGKCNCKCITFMLRLCQCL